MSWIFTSVGILIVLVIVVAGLLFLANMPSTKDRE